MEIFVLLGARTPKNDKGEVTFPLFTTTRTNTNKSTEGEVSGGWARMGGLRILRQQLLQDIHPSNMLVLVTGGKEPNVEHSRAENLSHALVTNYGFNEDQVISITSPKATTQGNAESIIEYLAAHKLTDQTPLVMNLVTNDFHMLRAWLLFAMVFYKHTHGTDFVLPSEDVEEIRNILTKALEDISSHKTQNPDLFRDVRDHVLSVVRPHLVGKLPVQLECCVVEDIFQHSHQPLMQKYSEWLRGHPKVLETTRHEYQGILDLLEGKYRQL